MYRFYNAGRKIEEIMPYSVSTGPDVHCVAHWWLRAPEEGFFEVPTHLDIPSTGETITVHFARDIVRKFGERGVIQIVAGYNEAREDAESPVENFPFAATDERAIERGKDLFERYLRKVVEAHLNDCQNSMASGGAPKVARGFTKWALERLNIEDPGERFFQQLQKGPTNSDSALAAQVNTLTALVGALLTGQKLDPSVLAGLNAGGAVKTNVMQGNPKPVTTDGYAGEPVQGKNVRNKQAERALQEL